MVALSMKPLSKNAVLAVTLMNKWPIAAKCAAVHMSSVLMLVG